MTIFTIIAALMILLALAILAPALLRKREMAASDRDAQNVIIARERLQEMEGDLQAQKISQEEFDQAKVELEQALLLDLKHEQGPEVTTGPGRLTLVSLTLALPLVSIFMYLMLGAPQMVEFDASKHAAPVSSNQGKMPSVEEMLAAIKQRLAEKPDDAKGWFLLGRSYMALERYPEAAQAYEKLLELTGDEPTVMLSLAEAMILSQAGEVKGRPTELIQKALKLAPENQSALWMSGLVESKLGNYPKAVEHWKKLESMVQDQPETLKKVQAMIAMAEKAAAAPEDK